MEIVECAFFRVTRDADFEVSDDADDLLEAVRDELRRRRFGDPVRLEVSRSVSTRDARRLLKVGLDVGDEEVYLVEGLLDLSELDQLAALRRPDLKDDPWLPASPTRFTGARPGRPVRPDQARRRARPPPVRLVPRARRGVRPQAAAADPDVVALKTTVYRTSDDSPLVPALIAAAEDGQADACASSS